MRWFARRRLYAGLATLIVAVALGLMIASSSYHLYRSEWISGWALLGLMIFLTGYNARKKVPSISIGRSRTWLQLHLYVGYLTIFLFVAHVGLIWPRGVLEITITVLYLCVAASGLFGIFITRAVPSRLATRGEEILFERIPFFRGRLQKRARELTLQANEANVDSAVPAFYAGKLSDFFDRPRHFWLHLVQSNRPRHALLAGLGDLDRYLNDDEREIVGELTDIVKKKDDLDYHHALQATLKYWLFSHIVATYSLMILVVVHVILVHLFSGGIRG